ncbi:MAG: hypothetical protein WC829_22000 [Hyphomicrobium sp.]|jgi:hypothetical protein
MRNIALATIALSLAATGAAADCTSDVNEAFAKLRKSAAFRMETKITNPQGTLTMSNDYVLPDRMHQTVSMNSALEKAGPEKMEMILIAGKAWSNQGNAGWAEVPEKFASTIAKQMKETVAEPPKDVSQFECLGDVTFEGKTYAGYRAKRGPAKTPDGAGPNPAAADETVQTVYVDKGLGIPVRNIVTAEKAPDKRLFDGTFSLPDGLTIEPPKL